LQRLVSWVYVILWLYADMENKTRKNETIKYKVFGVRLHEETKKKLIKKQKQSGLSWNLFILKLIEKQQYESTK